MILLQVPVVLLDHLYAGAGELRDGEYVDAALHQVRDQRVSDGVGDCGLRQLRLRGRGFYLIAPRLFFPL